MGEAVKRLCEKHGCEMWPDGGPDEWLCPDCEEETEEAMERERERAFDPLACPGCGGSCQRACR